MDAIKNAIGGKSGFSGHTSNQQSSSGRQQDYGDKAFKAVNDKAGWGLNESQREQVTDFGRNAYEQKSGNKVDPKISN